MIFSGLINLFEKIGSFFNKIFKYLMFQIQQEKDYKIHVAKVKSRIRRMYKINNELN